MRIGRARIRKSSLRSLGVLSGSGFIVMPQRLASESPGALRSHGELISEHRLRNGIIGAIVALTLIITPSAPAIRAQQAGTTRFVYDDNGRLAAVITPTGEAAAYDYDSAGNFTAVRRIGADTLTLLAFFPHQGGGGDEVTLVGTGFNAGVTAVFFNGSSAQIVNATSSAVVAIVPDAATTGQITIVTPRGIVTTPTPFSVVARVRVLPATTTLLAGDTAVFTAIVGGGGAQNVIWAVNGIAGGGNAVGTISISGLYTAPSLPGNASIGFVVRATSVAQPTLFGESRVKVLNPNALSFVLTPSLSVRKGDPRALLAARAPVVSVRRGTVIGGPNNAYSAPVSVNFGAAGKSMAAVFGSFVSATTGPAISAITPASIPRGATVTVTVTGANLVGTTNLRFINSSGAIDPAVTASLLTVNAEGTQLTATVSVAGSAVTSNRVVVVISMAGTTLPVAAGPNTIAIQ